MSLVTVQPVRRRWTLRDPTAAVLCGLIGLAAVLRLVLSARSAGDYSVGTPVNGDNAAPAIDALVHGHLSAAASHQPLMGLGSIILRLPFAMLAAASGAGHQLTYELGALACLCPLLLLVTWMTNRRGIAREQRLTAGIAGLIMLCGPATAEAVHVGHPEEVLAATLATAAVVAALRGRRTLTWLLLGLAVGTKQWAVLAVPAVLLALPERRLATVVRAGALALVLSGTLPLIDPGGFSQAAASVGQVRFANQFSIWWPLGSPIAGAGHGAFLPTAHLLPLGLTRSNAAALGLMIAFALLWFYAFRRGGRMRSSDALALLALCGLARCIADPAPLQYYYLAVLIPLAAWEVVTVGRLPVATALAAGAVAWLAGANGALTAGGETPLAPAILDAVSITWSLGLGIYLARRLVHPGRRCDLAPEPRPALARGAV